MRRTELNTRSQQMANIRSANSETSVRHVLDSEIFDSRDSSVVEKPSFYRSTSERSGLAADGCYFNAVFNDSSETFVDDDDTTGRTVASSGTPVAVSDTSTTMVRRLPVAPATATDGSQPFRRSHSMRSSFNSLRGLRTRLKQSTSSTTVNARTVYTHLPNVGDLARSPTAAGITKHANGNRNGSVASNSSGTSSNSGSHFSRSTGDGDIRRSLRHKLHKLKITYNELRRLQTKVLQEKYTLNESSEAAETTILPENIPPKAAALLMEGFTRANVAQSSLKVHRRPPEGNTTVTVTRSSSVRLQERPPSVAAASREQPTAVPSAKLTVVRKQHQTQEVEPTPPATPMLEVIGGNVYQPAPTPVLLRKVPSPDEVEEVNHPADHHHQQQQQQQLASHGHRHQQREQLQPALTVTRTATIRKGSVWANNSTSKTWDGHIVGLALGFLIKVLSVQEGGENLSLGHQRGENCSKLHRAHESVLKRQQVHFIPKERVKLHTLTSKSHPHPVIVCGFGSERSYMGSDFY